MSYDSRIIGIYNAYCERVAADGISAEPIDHFVDFVVGDLSVSMDLGEDCMRDFVFIKDAFYIFDNTPDY